MQGNDKGAAAADQLAVDLPQVLAVGVDAQVGEGGAEYLVRLAARQQVQAKGDPPGPAAGREQNFVGFATTAVRFIGRPARHSASSARRVRHARSISVSSLPRRLRKNQSVESLADLRRRRALQCRLTPDRALESVAEAEDFLCDRGLLTRSADCALPSLYEACHEDPYRPGSPGFATWPATKWPWFGELADRGYLVTAVHRGKNLIVSGEVARLLDPICRAEIARMRAADARWGRLLDHLADAGPSLADDLRVELRLKRQELTALRTPLERCGAVVSRSLELPSVHGNAQTRELARWDQVYGRPAGATPDPGVALGDLVVAGVRAAVLAPEPELRRWFSWTWYWTGSLIDDLVQQGRLRRIGEGLLAAPEAPAS